MLVFRRWIRIAHDGTATVANTPTHVNWVSTLLFLSSVRLDVLNVVYYLEFIGAVFEYYKYNNDEFPKRIYLYRDGVGDGQIANVRQTEVIQLV